MYFAACNELFFFMSSTFTLKKLSEADGKVIHIPIFRMRKLIKGVNNQPIVTRLV